MPLAIVVDRSAPPLLSHQISRAIAEMIHRGTLPANARLPATRELARSLCVGRTTVVEAYDILADQGYICARRGSGTRVQECAMAHAPTHREAPAEQRLVCNAAASAQVQIDFRPDLPDLAAFPKRQWLMSLRRASRDVTLSDLDFGDPLGSIRLRRAVACYLGRSRSLQVSPRNLVITSGAAQSVGVVLRALSAATEAIVEEPGATWLQELLSAEGIAVRKLPVDAQGLRTDLLPEKGGHLAHVTPSHQWPSGFVMDAARREALAAWASRTDSYVFEDDEERELALHGPSTLPIAALDSARRVIYSGSFSKTLAPAIRIGFVVLPDELLDRVNTIKPWRDLGGSPLHQEAMAQLLEKGAFERHVQRMRRLYWARFQLLTSTLETLLKSRVRILGQPTGTYVSASVRTRDSAEELRRKARALGVNVHPIEGSLAATQADEQSFVFGFGNLSTSQILAGARAFAQVVSTSA